MEKNTDKARICTKKQGLDKIASPFNKEAFMLMENPRTKFYNDTVFYARRPEKVRSNKIFAMKEIALLSSLIFCAGITLGVAIMQYLTH